jgi:two-component system, cell cycle response regulator
MRVVLVDPSRTVLKCLSRTLETQGHDVHPFTDGTEALQYIKLNHLVDVLITSAQLSSMSGRELCLEVRRVASCRRPIYILLMSSSDEHRNLIEALDSGADDFISKPPITEELYARLRAANRIVSMQRELIGQATTDFLTEVLGAELELVPLRDDLFLGNRGKHDRGCAVILECAQHPKVTVERRS